jgi:3-deoxy-D-manno-octulosonic-acid transferase
MIRTAYNLLYPLGFLALLPGYLERMFRRGDYRQDFGQRFARYSPALKQRFAKGEWIWVHAVSVGELLVALKLMETLHARHPSWQFVVSSTTSTAHALALKKQTDWWVPVYTPVDIGRVVKRALRTVRPRAIILTESEMWPNFIWTASDLRIPVVLVNARVSPRSAGRYRRFAPIVAHVTRHLAAVGLQEPQDADIWEDIGVNPARLRLTGSVKCDPEADEAPPQDYWPVLRSFGFTEGAPILLGGSTHRGEEEILGAALVALRKTHPRARLIIVPRHVERTPEIISQFGVIGLRVGRRTAGPTKKKPDVLLVDTTGELRDWYSCADIVFIGKSLCGGGGQNPVEAIVAGKPVLFGPEMQNFAGLAASLLDNGAASEVYNAQSIAARVSLLLADPERRRAMVRAAAEVLDTHRGATLRTAQLIEDVLTGSDSDAPDV